MQTKIILEEIAIRLVTRRVKMFDLKSELPESSVLRTLCWQKLLCAQESSGINSNSHVVDTEMMKGPCFSFS